MSPEQDISIRGTEPVFQHHLVAIPGTGPSLSEQARGLGRATTMKKVVGPLVTELLEPVYTTEFTDRERGDIPPMSVSRNADTFYENVLGVLVRRVHAPRGNLTDSHIALRELIEGVDEFFHYKHVSGVLEEGVKSGLAVPLRLALQIYGLEQEIENPDEGSDLFKDKSFPIDISQLIEIMERESFDEILFRLTKGPNGFLGRHSTGFGSGVGRVFFDFSSVDNPPSDKSLKVHQAFEVADGKVVGLRDAYYIAANRKRDEIRWRYEQYESNPMADTNPHKHKIADSSGCPVRHSFPDPETGEGREPIVITAKKFLIAALQISREQQEAA